MKFLNDIADLDPNLIDQLLMLAKRLQNHPEPDALKGKILALLFLSPSLRTMTSFQSGMARLGGNSFMVSPDMAIHNLELEDGVVMDGNKAEHIREALPVIASYADILGVRAFAKQESLADDLDDVFFNNIYKLIDKPLINMESAIQHPCQSLADWKTLDELDIPKKGGKFVLSWAYHPKALPLAVPSSTLKMATKRGMDVTLLCPEEYILPDAIMQVGHQLASQNGGNLSISHDQKSCMNDADIIYAKSWVSPIYYGRNSEEGAIRAKYKNWCVNDDWFDTNSTCKFMHCLPVRRNVVVSDSVLNSERSVVLKQANNRLWAQMAVLYHMLLGV